MPYHTVLAKQLEKYLPSNTNIDPAYAQLLQSVSDYYSHLERDKQASEAVFEKTEDEFREVLENLKIEIAIRRQSVSRIREQIIALAPDSFHHDDELKGEENLSEIIGFLEKQINKSKLLEEDLIRAKDEAEHSANAKTNFLSLISHEIRTPLNAIIGNIHILQHEQMLPEQADYIEALSTSANNLLSLVNDILDFARIEAGRVQLSYKDVDIRKMVKGILKAHTTSASERKSDLQVNIDAGIPDFLHTDDIRLSQVLNNLVSNAIKFTSEGSIIVDLKLDYVNASQVAVIFSVYDTGIGIHESLHEKIFERFVQANSEINRSYGGSGLGLTIIKRLLQIMGSEIKLQSSPGKGSRFYFTLTCKPALKTMASSIEATKQKLQLNGISVLLVEDIAVNIMVARKMLTTWGAIVDVAKNGEEAIAKVMENKYGVILMDLQMPVMDGITATKILRSQGVSVPIVALTASVTAETQQKIKLIGMDAYVSKPFNPSDLHAVIESLLQSKEIEG